MFFALRRNRAWTNYISKKRGIPEKVILMGAALHQRKRVEKEDGPDS